MRTKLIVIVILAAAGVILLPLEHKIYAERQALKSGGAILDIQIRKKVGQNLAIALLAGFRGVTADFLWIVSHEYWEKKEWVRQADSMQLVTTLQPQSVMFWDLAAWHMAWNIAYAVRTDPENEKKYGALAESVGIKREREWHLRGRDLLVEGIKNIPNKYDLFYKLGWLYWQKLDDYPDSAFYLQKAAAFASAPAYVGRLYAQALERSNEPEKAYAYWVKLWHQPRNTPNQLWSVIEREVKRLEELLDIPSEKRVPRNPDGSLKEP